MGKKSLKFHNNEPLRWQAARMDGNAKNRGIRNVRKQPKNNNGRGK